MPDVCSVKYIGAADNDGAPNRMPPAKQYIGTSGIATGLVTTTYHGGLGMFLDKWNGSGVFSRVYSEKQMARKINVTRTKTWADVLAKVSAMVLDNRTVVSEFQLPGGQKACIMVTLGVPQGTPDLFWKVDTLPAGNMIVVGEAFLQWVRTLQIADDTIAPTTNNAQ